MTRDQMIEFIKANPNVKVTHDLFGYDEYIYMGNDGNVYTEEGYVFEDFETDGYCDGLRLRVGGRWEDGWSIKETEKTVEIGIQKNGKTTMMKTCVNCATQAFFRRR